jgi:hypothetical protein
MQIIEELPASVSVDFTSPLDQQGPAAAPALVPAPVPAPAPAPVPAPVPAPARRQRAKPHPAMKHGKMFSYN